jgi:hypothetical protein
MDHLSSASEVNVLLVELKQRSDIRGTTDVSITPTNIVEKSSEALNKAMDTVKGMAAKVVATVQDIPLLQRPDEIEAKFGLKLTTDANALIVNAGSEAHFTIKMKWINHSQGKAESTNQGDAT